MRPCLKNNRILGPLISFSLTTIFISQFWELWRPQSKCLTSLVLGESSLSWQVATNSLYAHMESKSQPLDVSTQDKSSRRSTYHHHSKVIPWELGHKIPAHAQASHTKDPGFDLQNHKKEKQKLLGHILNTKLHFAFYCFFSYYRLLWFLTSWFGSSAAPPTIRL